MAQASIITAASGAAHELRAVMQGRVKLGVIARYIDNPAVSTGVRHEYLLIVCKLRISGTSDRKQIDRHCQPHQRQKESNRGSMA